MAKEKCVNCGSKPGKRKCLINNGALICPVCCATIRNEDCAECVFYQTSAEFTQKKQEKESTSAGSYFGSPAMQKRHNGSIYGAHERLTPRLVRNTIRTLINSWPTV